MNNAESCLSMPKLLKLAKTVNGDCALQIHQWLRHSWEKYLCERGGVSVHSNSYWTMSIASSSSSRPTLQDIRYHATQTIKSHTSAFNFKIAGELKFDRAGTSRREIRERFHDRFSGVEWALDRPDLGDILLLFKPISAFELSSKNYIVLKI